MGDRSMERVMELAKELGGAIARTDEYQAVRRALEIAEEDKTFAAARDQVQGLLERLEGHARRRETPQSDLIEEYESAVGELQTNTTYQRIAAAEANLEKLMAKVHERMNEGVEEGSKSRIVLL